MAKYRHRTFEMFDFLEEAKSALSTKSARHDEEAVDPESWQFQHLRTSRDANVIHVTFKKKDRATATFPAELRADFSKLADLLVNDSRALLDLKGLNEFGAECIDELKRFHAKLQSKGSRMVLCQLEPAVRDSFFPHRMAASQNSANGG